jgi:hypothetical protein
VSVGFREQTSAESTSCTSIDFGFEGQRSWSFGELVLEPQLLLGSLGFLLLLLSLLSPLASFTFCSSLSFPFLLQLLGREGALRLGGKRGEWAPSQSAASLIRRGTEVKQ